MNGHANIETGEAPRSVLVLPRAVDEIADEEPDRTWLCISKSNDLSTGWRNITFRELADAVNGMAAWTEEHLGPGNGKDTVAYMGEGVDTAVDILKATDPKLQVYGIPSFDDLRLRGSDAGPYAEHCNDAEDDQVLILHTSGSTGTPKPIHITNGYLATMSLLRSMPAPKGRRNTHDEFLMSDQLLFTMSPFFHTMGIIVLMRSLLCKSPLVLLPLGRPVSAELILEVLQQTKPWGGIFAPSMLEQISSTPNGLDVLAELKYVFYGGAPLAHDSGERIKERTVVSPLIGTTEAGFIPVLLPAEKADWEYFEWSPGSGVNMEPEDDGLYEMVIKREDRKYQGLFHTFPHLDAWRTNDLWERHATKPTLWLYKGRKDDVIVLSNGEKINPVAFEKALESGSLVNGALVVGQGRFQTGLLVEPDWSTLPQDQSLDDFVDRLWPMIERANAATPAHGRVWKSKIAVAKRDKPFHRAPKGSTMRRLTVGLYRREIDALYSNEASNDQLGKLEDGADLQTIKGFVRRALKLSGLAFPDDALEDADIFNYGADSLQVLAISTTLSHACSSKERKVTVSPKIIYAHPTVAHLAEYLQNGGQGAANNGTVQSREEIMTQMIEKYTHDLPPASSIAAPPQAPQKHTVILTGSTGALGNCLLEELITSSQVAKVICLNRSAGAEARQRQSFQSRGVEAEFSNVEFLHTDFSQDRFGLSDDVYGRLLQTVDVFIHNAWTVDFNHSLESYESTHIAGTRRCLDFSIQSKYRAHVVFVSSIASVGNWLAKHTRDEEVPECTMNDHTLPLPQGYGESKHVAALVLAAAAQRSGIASTICRAGQLAGPSKNGLEWNRHEWLPTIILTSKAMGIVPATLGNQEMVDWVPIDLAAKIVLECLQSRIVDSGNGDLLKTAHVVNPRRITWSDLVPVIRDSLQRETGTQIQVVPFERWVAELRDVPATREEAERKPGVKLIDFYQGFIGSDGGLPVLATSETMAMSETMRAMGPIDGKLMQHWLQQWQT
ncbi:hypothetical protein LTR36_003868 [Oleoguttula mirabilis]|uniref:Carrier domain-containing protein n=1 Tax=Oleoguttula mirabilis TaxID=1507867 RepID=A0AAV9JJ94_9PEZI|nr:hypothetical protein LTR36_003868 [Oleoguttula mirabilis]